MILAFVVVCEVASWGTIVAGLVARYVLRRPRLGAGFLIAAPLIDVVLLILVASDLLRGGTASWEHGLAAVYIGFSIAFGHPLIAWADIRFAHRFAGGPRPVALAGSAYAKKCWKDLLRTLLMAAIASAIVGILVLLVGDAERTEGLLAGFRIVGIVLVVDFLWAVSYTIWPKKPAPRSQPVRP